MSVIRENLELLINTNAKAQAKDFDSLSASFTSFAKTAISVTAVLSTLDKAFDFVSDSISLFRKDMLELKKTEAIINATDQSAGLTATEIKNLANQLQDLTGVSNTTFIATQNLLLTFKSIQGDVFKRALNVVADMSILFGSAESAAIQLGKALEEPEIGLSALRRVGVSFTESEKELIKSLVNANKVAEAQSVILSVLEKQFGGVAIASRDAIQGLKNDFDDFKKVIGEGFNPVVEAVANNLSKIIKDLPLVLGLINKQQYLNEQSVDFETLYYEKIKDGSEEELINLRIKNSYLRDSVSDQKELLKIYKEMGGKTINLDVAGVDRTRYNLIKKHLEDLFGTTDEDIIEVQLLAKEKNFEAVTNAINKALDEIEEKKKEISLINLFIPSPDIKEQTSITEEGLEDIIPVFESEEVTTFINKLKESKKIATEISEVFEDNLTNGISDASSLLLNSQQSWERWGELVQKILKGIIADLIKMQLLFSFGKVFGLNLGGSNILKGLFGVSSFGGIVNGPVVGQGSTDLVYSNRNLPQVNVDVSINPDAFIKSADNRIFATKTRIANNELARVSL